MSVATQVQTCPSWCTVPAEDHARDLEGEGTTCHFAEDQIVATLPSTPRPRRSHLGLSTVHGGEKDGQAVVYVGDTELSPQQARELATSLLALVEAYEND